jgi:hypothetical protein
MVAKWALESLDWAKNRDTGSGQEMIAFIIA